MTKLKQRRRAHSITRRSTFGLRRAVAVSKRDICARFNDWSAGKRFRAKEQPVVVSSVDVTAQGALMGDVVILGPQTWMVDATEAGLLELRPQQADDLLNPYALEYRAPEQRWVRSSRGPR